MASFRNAQPSMAAICFFLFLVVVQQPVPLARAQLLSGLGTLGTDLSNLIPSSSAFNLQSLLKDVNVLNPFNLASLPSLPSLPTTIADIPQFSEEALRAVLDPVINLAQPPQINPQVQDLLKSAQDADPEAVATVGVLSATFLLVSAILFTVSSGLAVGATTVGVVAAGANKITGPINFLLSADELQLQVRNDAHGSGDKLFNKWNDALTSVADQLGVISSTTSNAGTFASNLAALRTQMSQARDMLKTALSKFN